ncbi:MAG TPA: hypothetical protein PK919_02170 [Candidatus Aminicenantes bacterium]|nr:hypothetical protein [Candidatus Aminicenantes bacterium]
MREWQQLLERQEEPGGPGRDFEERVFAKIRRVKRRRQAGIGLAAAFAAVTVAVLAAFQIGRPASGRAPLRAADKEEVPVSEELFFATSDGRTRYTLQPVALGGSQAPQAASNQI